MADTSCSAMASRHSAKILTMAGRGTPQGRLLPRGRAPCARPRPDTRRVAAPLFFAGLARQFDFLE